MKKINLIILSILMFAFINGCSRNPEPQVRIQNEQPIKVNVKIQTTDTSKTSVNEIEAGETTSYQTTTEGNVTATSLTQNASVSFLAAKNTKYTIVISKDNPPAIRVDK